MPVIVWAPSSSSSSSTVTYNPSFSLTVRKEKKKWLSHRWIEKKNEYRSICSRWLESYRGQHPGIRSWYPGGTRTCASVSQWTQILGEGEEPAVAAIPSVPNNRSGTRREPRERWRTPLVHLALGTRRRDLDRERRDDAVPDVYFYPAVYASSTHSQSGPGRWSETSKITRPVHVEHERSRVITRKLGMCPIGPSTIICGTCGAHDAQSVATVSVSKFEHDGLSSHQRHSPNI